MSGDLTEPSITRPLPLVLTTRRKGSSKASLTRPTIYSRVLSAGEILSIYNSGIAGKCAPPTCAGPPWGLVSWWRGESNAVDCISGNNGVLSNGVTYAQAEVNQGFCFNTTSNYIEVPDSPGLRLTNELTVELWVKRLRLDSPAPDYILEKGGDWTGNDQNYGVALHWSLYNYCVQFLTAGAWRGAGSISDTNWHHVAVTARNGDSDPTFYIDGVQQPVLYGEGGNINLNPSTRPLHIGAQVDPQSGWFTSAKPSLMN